MRRDERQNRGVCVYMMKSRHWGHYNLYKTKLMMLVPFHLFFSFCMLFICVPCWLSFVIKCTVYPNLLADTLESVVFICVVFLDLWLVFYISCIVVYCCFFLSSFLMKFPFQSIVILYLQKTKSHLKQPTVFMLSWLDLKESRKAVSLRGFRDFFPSIAERKFIMQAHSHFQRYAF